MYIKCHGVFVEGWAAKFKYCRGKSGRGAGVVCPLCVCLVVLKLSVIRYVYKGGKRGPVVKWYHLERSNLV